MSSGKRSSSSASRGRPKRPRSTATPSTSTALVVPPATLANSTLDMEALTASITASVTTAVQAAMERQRLPTAATTDATTISVAEAVSEQLAEITTPTSGTEERGTSGASRNVDHSDKLVFSSLALELGGGVTDKIKAKIWANEYVDLGLLLAATPGPDRYSISIDTSSPSSGAQLTLEPCKPPKKILNINQWLSAFNTFVAIYVIRFPQEAPNLLKYCEIVRDIAAKFGDWSFYDEQFRLLRQTAPRKYPWDAVHWELWLKVTFRGCQAPSRGEKQQGNRARSNQPPFPKGTCWNFQTGRSCGDGCKFEHKCYKCGAKHPATRCNNVGTGRAGVQSPSQIPPRSSPAHNAGKGRST